MEKVIVFSVNSIHNFAIPFSFEAMDALLNMQRVDIDRSKLPAVTSVAHDQSPLDVRVMLKDQILPPKVLPVDDYAPEHQAPAGEQFEVIPEAPVPVPRLSVPPLEPVAPIMPWEDPLVPGDPTPPAPDFDQFDDDIPF